mmetsp:Transcript_45112/g.115390  ORF Transcript_45112/g.115390 Transcript_45112/m.115390 type:complete len:206 (+) Transcript_45112:783-1400(+)
MGGRQSREPARHSRGAVPLAPGGAAATGAAARRSPQRGRRDDNASPRRLRAGDGARPVAFRFQSGDKLGRGGIRRKRQFRGAVGLPSAAPQRGVRKDEAARIAGPRRRPGPHYARAFLERATAEADARRGAEAAARADALQTGEPLQWRQRCKRISRRVGSRGGRWRPALAGDAERGGAAAEPSKEGDRRSCSHGARSYVRTNAM